MKITKYLKFFLTAIAIYLIFLIRGLPNNHYLEWTQKFHIADCIEIIIFTLPIVYFTLRWFSKKTDYFKDSIWFAFFLSIPFLILDIVNVGIIRGHGIGYFSTFWFLTIFYFIVWIEVPIIGYLMHKDDHKITKKHLMIFSIAVVMWLLNFWEGSYSNHYLNWSLNMKITRITNILLILMPIAYLLLRFYSSKKQYFRDAGLISLYFSCIFILFDFLYLGISKNYWLQYIQDYWFITIFYPIFWIEIPLIGWFMQRNTLKKENL